MNKSKIEWCDYTINPVKGLCPMACSYCYARRMYKRFGWNPEPRVQIDAFEELKKIKKPSRIFVGSTFELFHEICEQYDTLKWIFNTVKHYPQHTFIFLTKKPENLIKWSPFPDNCWVGVSSTGGFDMTADALGYLWHIESKVKFISFEPLLNENKVKRFPGLLNNSGINWLIIGQQTPVKLSTMPKVGWVEEIVHAADKAHIPVFLKDNLISCVDQYEFAMKHNKLRQELPTIQNTPDCLASKGER